MLEVAPGTQLLSLQTDLLVGANFFIFIRYHTENLCTSGGGVAANETAVVPPFELLMTKMAVVQSPHFSECAQ